jgi:nuclear transport factor 2 (NTF2) superfamily protein
MTVQEWVDAYGRAWRDRDPDAAAVLFTEDGMYRDHPTREARRGRDGVRSYWADVTATQEDPDVRMGEPIVSADEPRGAVEFWVRMRSSGEQVTVIGILFLRFAEDGRCEELRETWHFETGDHVPPDDWGL